MRRFNDTHRLLLTTAHSDAFTRMSLLQGLDEIGMTLQHEAEIAAYEKSHR